MTRLRFTLSLAIIFTLMRFVVLAQEQPAWEIESLTEQGGAVYDLLADITTATNGVIIKRGNTIITADGVTVYHQTGDVLASGHVRIQQGNQLWVGDQLKYNFNTRRMEGREFRTGVPPVFMSGQNLQGDLNTNAYSATGAFFTTDDVPDPGHRLRASRIRIYPGKRVEAWNASLYVGKVPVFYFPYYRRTLGERANHFNFTPGYRNKYGPFLLTSYLWFLNDDVDGAVNLDYRIERGVGVGPDLNLHLGQWGETALKYYYLHDLAPGGGDIPSDRHRLLFTYLAEPYTNFTVRSVVRYESDPRILRDFFESEYRSNPQQPTFVEANKVWNNFSLDALAQGRVNDFVETVDRLPEIKLNAFPQQIGNLPVFYESDSSIGYYRRLFAQTNGPVMQDYEATRGDTFHQLTAPITAFGWLNIVPRAGGRFTYYADDTGPGGTNSAQSRAVFNTGARFSFKASRTWSEPKNALFDLDGIRHIIEPSVDYVFVPAPDVRPDQIPQFDTERPSLRLLPIEFPDYNSIDSIDSQNSLRLGLRNRIQTKRLGRVEDFLDWQLYTDWRLDPQHGQNNFSDIYSDLSVHFRSWISLESFTRFDVNTENLRLAFHSISFRPNDTWSWSLGHYYLLSDYRSSPTALGAGNNSISSIVLYRPTENWSFAMTHRFDARLGKLQEQDYTVYRDFRSWVGALDFSIRNSQGRSEDFAIVFRFALKAHPHSGPNPIQSIDTY